MNFLVESNNYLMDFSYFLFLFSCGFALASIPVSMLWQSMQMNKKELDDKNYIPYIEKYSLDELDDGSKEPETNNIILEHTPNDGMVLMRYNKEHEGFEYWSESKQIDFKILKTVCRKYCLFFNQKSLYVDGYEEYLKQKEMWEKKKEEEKKREEEKKEKKNSDFVEEDEDDCVFIKPKVILNEKTQKKEVKVEWKENKFIRRGNINESPLHEKKEKPTKQFSFNDFKNMMKEKKN